MGADSARLRLPKIDLSGPDLHPGSESWGLVRAQVQQALESYGFFEAVYTKSPPELQPLTFRELKELFALPLATKQRNTSPKLLHGYVWNSLKSPLYESIGIDLTEEVESFTSLMWPQGNPTFNEIICSLRKVLQELDHMVRRMILESLGVEKYYDSHLESTNYLLRGTKYKRPETKEEQVGLGAHTDTSMLTVLCQTYDGLEIQTKDGEWIPIVVSPGSFIVMVGDSFLAWSNGRLQSSRHRVTVSGNEEERYSVGLFSFPRPKYMLQAPEELVDEEHPLLFKPFDFHEFLKAICSEPAPYHKCESPLKAYCGA